MLRKALIARAVFWTYTLGRNLQSTSVLTILSVALTMQSRFWPFDRRYEVLNYLQFDSLACSWFIFLAGGMYSDPHTNDTARMVINVSLLRSNLFLVAWFATLLFPYTVHRLVAASNQFRIFSMLHSRLRSTIGRMWNVFLEVQGIWRLVPSKQGEEYTELLSA